MKIIFCNAWHGTLEQELRAFFKEHQSTTDVFCLQEAAPSVREWCKELLPDHIPYNAEKLINEKTAYMQTTYVRRPIEVHESHALLDETPALGLGLYTHLIANGRHVHLVNIHGVPRPGKLDTPERIQQSELLLSSLKQKTGIKIIGGDFNVLPDTKTIQMLEAAGYRNLVTEYSIPTTRNHFAWEKHPGNELYHSDYIFIQGEAHIQNFSVPALEISDHLPLIVEFEI